MTPSDRLLHPPSSPEYYRRSINIDISNKCSLRCPSCDRVLSKDMVKRARDISVGDYNKLVAAFSNITMCGQISDPISHPNLLQLIRNSKRLRRLSIMTHGSGRSREWWDAVFNVCLENNNVHWTFALDGLPNESHKYRINQDGEAVWEVMKYGKSRGIDIAWQYIPFAYNEDHIQQAAAMAAEQGIAFHLKLSSRHPEGMIPINPANRIDRMRVED